MPEEQTPWRGTRPEVYIVADSEAPQGQSQHAEAPAVGWRAGWRRFRSHRGALWALVGLTLIVAATALADVLTPYGANDQHLDRILEGPSGDFLLGTDTLGRDNLTRVLTGGRVSLMVGGAVALLSGIVGTTVGLVAGYYRRWIDATLMRAADTMLALPGLMVVIMAARIIGDDVSDVVIVLAGLSWMVNARIVRGKVLALREFGFIEAARALGVSNRRIMLRHLLPNLTGEVAVSVSLTVAGAILAESTLSFLGLGVSAAHTPTWGNMLGGNEGFVVTAPWLVWAPGLAIVATVLCVNFIGDGLRDLLDPTE